MQFRVTQVASFQASDAHYKLSRFMDLLQKYNLGLY